MDMTVKQSTDEGATWPLAYDQVIWEGPSAYSVLVPLPGGGGVGILFERGVNQPYEHVSFAAVQPISIV